MVLSQMSRAVRLPSFNKNTLAGIRWCLSEDEPARWQCRPPLRPAPIKGTLFFFSPPCTRTQPWKPHRVAESLPSHGLRQTVPLTAVHEIDSDAAPGHPGHARLCSRPALVEDPGLGQQGRARPAKPSGCPTIRAVPALALCRGLSAGVVLSSQAG